MEPSTQFAAAGIFVVDIDRQAVRLLIGKESKKTRVGTWGEPGGRRVRHENSRQTAVREFMEELSIDSQHRDTVWKWFQTCLLSYYHWCGGKYILYLVAKDNIDQLFFTRRHSHFDTFSEVDWMDVTTKNGRMLGPVLTTRLRGLLANPVVKKILAIEPARLLTLFSLAPPCPEKYDKTDP